MPDPQILHATSVAVGGRALLIQGASGSGKSGLALEMMVRGATLVADDRTIVTPRNSQLWVSVPEPIRGLIEARGVGLLRANTADNVCLAAVVDLDVAEESRLPPLRTISLMQHQLPLFHNSASPYFSASLVHYLRMGRKEVS